MIRVAINLGRQERTLYGRVDVAARGKRDIESVDSPWVLMHDNFIMPPTENDNRRRSSRVFTRIPVKVRGINTDGEKFRESCQTVVVNSHGGLLYLNQDVELGAQILLINPVSEEEQECRVVYLGDTSDKGTRIGVEFLSPAPHFWGVEFTTVEVRGRPTPSASR
jgi:hypothetical protein